jgi:hypothetical protein
MEDIMNETIIATLIATIVSTGFATFVSIYINRKKEQERFDLQLQNILSYPIKYPYLENRKFTEAWKPSLADNDIKYQRYENYCSIVFNFISAVCEWKKYNKKEIDKFIDVKDWLRIHERYWKNPVSLYENVDGYDEKFLEFVRSYIT